MRAAGVPAVPDGLGRAGRECWASVAPFLHGLGLLDDQEAQSDLRWFCQLHERLADLSGREDSGERLALLDVFRRLAHRYGLTPAGRAAILRRGRPWIRNPLLPAGWEHDTSTHED